MIDRLWERIKEDYIHMLIFAICIEIFIFMVRIYIEIYYMTWSAPIPEDVSANTIEIINTGSIF